MGEKNQKILPLCGAHSEKSFLFSAEFSKKFFRLAAGREGNPYILWFLP